MQDYVQNKIAHMWIKEIRRQRNVNKILKVQYNNIDITKKALELDTYRLVHFLPTRKRRDGRNALFNGITN